MPISGVYRKTMVYSGCMNYGWRLDAWGE